MKRIDYFNYVEEQLTTLVTRISMRSPLNLLELNIYSENFFADLFNLILDLELTNLNTRTHNVTAIDLKDEKTKTIAQVTATATKEKIQRTLSKKILKNYKSYKLIFIFIGNVDCTSLTKKKYKNIYEARFDPTEDIYDLKRILSIIQNTDLNKLEKIYNLVKEEIGSKPDIKEYNSDLTKVINALSKVPFSDKEPPDTLDFQIENKIKFNVLDDRRDFIKDYDIYLGDLNKKYSEFDRVGINTSLAILEYLKTEYRNLKEKKLGSLDILDKIMELAKDRVRKSSNIEDISEEMLEFCIRIIIVDAFMKCKIFENPKGDKYVTAR